MLGQQMLNRLHAAAVEKSVRVRDSAVMATRSPGEWWFRVWNSCYLGDLHKPDYHARKFKRQYVHFVQIRIDARLWLLMIRSSGERIVAAQCRGCEKSRLLPRAAHGEWISPASCAHGNENWLGAAQAATVQLIGADLLPGLPCGRELPAARYLRSAVLPVARYVLPIC